MYNKKSRHFSRQRSLPSFFLITFCFYHLKDVVQRLKHQLLFSCFRAYDKSTLPPRQEHDQREIFPSDEDGTQSGVKRNLPLQNGPQASRHFTSEDRVSRSERQRRGPAHRSSGHRTVSLRTGRRTLTLADCFEECQESHNNVTSVWAADGPLRID